MIFLLLEMFKDFWGTPKLPTISPSKPKKLTLNDVRNVHIAANKRQGIKMSINNGDLVKDTISGFQGIVVARTVWLNQCVRLIVQSKELHDGKPLEASFDEQQLEVVTPNALPVSEPKTFATTGGDRPTPSRSSTPSR